MPTPEDCPMVGKDSEFNSPVLGEDRRKWHIEKTINLSHLITTIGLAASVMIWASKMDTRVTVLEAAAAVQTRQNERAEQEAKDMKTTIAVQYVQLNDKLDKLIWDRVSRPSRNP